MKRKKILRKPINAMKLLLAAIAITVLVLVYLFQKINLMNVLFSGSATQHADWHPYTYFIVNKTLRMVINDLACFLLIRIFFSERKYIKVAFWVFLFELIILLPLYFIIKLNWEGDAEISSPLLSQIHRLIVNPTLMILLMLSFFYQQYKERNKLVE